MGFDVDDQSFFQSAEHRPNPTAIPDAEGIPLVDLSLLTTVDPTDPTAPSALAPLLAHVEAACRDWGFFQVTNHGVPADLLDGALAASKAFYDLPFEDKRRVRRDEDNPYGYHDAEHTKNVRDWKEVFDFLTRDPVDIPALDGPAEFRTLRNQWPAYPPGFREVCEEFAREVEKLAFKLLELIALTLHVPARRLDGYFDGHLSFIRLNHYPPCPTPHLALGVGRHKDSSALTVLLQDQVGGLDVKRRPDGEWVRLKPVPNALIINVGDVIQVWSNDKYESAEHRVTVNGEKERFSIPFFFNPGYDVMVKPLEEVVSANAEAARYDEYRFGEFFQKRNLSNFMRLPVENIQIEHFRKKMETIAHSYCDALV